MPMYRRPPSVGDSRIAFSNRVPAPATSIPAALATKSWPPASSRRLPSGPAISPPGRSNTMLTRSSSRATPTRMLVDALTGTGAAGHRTSSKTAAHTAADGLTFEPRTSGYSRLAARQQAEDESKNDAQDEAGGQGNIYDHRIPPDEDVTRQAGDLADHRQQRSDHHQRHPENHQYSTERSEFAQGGS